MRTDIELIIKLVTQRLATVVVRQLKVRHPADDDGLWWFSLPSIEPNIQIESSSYNCPFLIESNEQCSENALLASTVTEVVGFVVNYLTAVYEGRSIRMEGQLFWKPSTS